MSRIMDKLHVQSQQRLNQESIQDRAVLAVVIIIIETLLHKIDFFLAILIDVLLVAKHILHEMQQGVSSITLAHVSKLGRQLTQYLVMELRQHDRRGIALQVHERVTPQHPDNGSINRTGDMNDSIIVVTQLVLVGRHLQGLVGEQQTEDTPFAGILPGWITGIHHRPFVKVGFQRVKEQVVILISDSDKTMLVHLLVERHQQQQLPLGARQTHVITHFYQQQMLQQHSVCRRSITQQAINIIPHELEHEPVIQSHLL